MRAVAERGLTVSGFGRVPKERMCDEDVLHFVERGGGGVTGEVHSTTTSTDGPVNEQMRRALVVRIERDC